jgi:hypothetical protein
MQLGALTAAEFSLFSGWVGLLMGVLSGAAIGLCFHDESWLGGYGSHRRRLMRLGHISFFGLGFVNLFFGLTVRSMALGGAWVKVGAAAFLIGAVTMPLCCFLCAWRKPFRHLFPIPVAGVLTGIIAVLMAWHSAS